MTTILVPFHSCAGRSLGCEQSWLSQRWRAEWEWTATFQRYGRQCQSFGDRELAQMSHPPSETMLCESVRESECR